MREYPAGDDGLLLDFSRHDRPDAAAARVATDLRAAAAAGRLALADALAGAETVLVEAFPGAGLNELGVRRVVNEALATLASEVSDDAVSTAVVTVPTVYDGPDLEAVAHLVGRSTDEVVRAHTDTLWCVRFMGFAPGFGYLIPDVTSDKSDSELLRLPGRRDQSRTSVPAGSVALAAGYSAVYPRESPGGWHLLGRTDLPMWDSTADPPAVLTAGTVVRFERVDA